MRKRWKRSRQTPATPSGQWCGRPPEMLESAAYRVLSRAAHLALSRIELELRYHGGKDNGCLPVTFEDFVAYGVNRDSIAPALRELQALGFVEITQHGRGGNAEHRAPNLFRLTYEPIKDAPPANEWKRFAVGADPNADAEVIAKADHVARTARRNWNPMLVARMKKLAVEKQKPVRKTRIGPGAENQDRKPNFPDPENQDYRVSPETRTTIDTIGEGEPQMSTATNPPAANGHDPTPPPAPAFPSLLMRKAEGERL